MAYSIERAHIRDLAKVKPFWKAMVEHYHDTLAGQWPVRTPEQAWQLRHQEYMTWINEGTGVVFIARDAHKEAVGYAALHFSSVGSTFDLGDSFGELESLAVHAEHRNHGLGAKLIEACRKELHKRDIGYWTLDTLAADTRTNRLYAKAGFAPFMLKMVQSVEEVGAVDPTFTAAMPVVPMPTTARTPGEPVAAEPIPVEGVTAPAGGSEADGGAVARDQAVAGEARPGEAAVAAVPVGTGGAAAEGVGHAADPRTAEAHRVVTKLATASRTAARGLALLRRTDKDELLRGMADQLTAHADEILAANRTDLERGTEQGFPGGLLDRLRLDESRLAAIADALRDVAAPAGPGR